MWDQGLLSRSKFLRALTSLLAAPTCVVGVAEVFLWLHCSSLSICVFFFALFWPFLANSTTSRAVDAWDALDAFDAVCVCRRRRPGCLFVYILSSSCLIMLFGAYFVQKVGFCPFLANLAESESGGAVDASAATGTFAVGAECVLQPLQTCFLAPSWPFGSNQAYLPFSGLCINSGHLW